MARSPKGSVIELSEQPPLTKESDKEDTDDSDEDEILETSENGRWQKIDQHVSERARPSKNIIRTECVL